MERVDLLHLIHKALRHAILTFNLESGRTDFTDRDMVASLSASWLELCTNLGHHATHEDEIVFPLLSARAPGEPRHPYQWDCELDALYDDHSKIERLESDLDDLLRSIEDETGPVIRRLFGRELHRAVQRYTAMCLLDFDDEERHLMPRLWTLYDDDELRRSYDRILASVGPEERQFGMRHMLDALDPVELDQVRERLAEAS